MNEKIHVEPDFTGIAPRDYAWSAWFGDYDLGTTVGHGATKEAAIADLRAQTEKS